MSEISREGSRAMTDYPRRAGLDAYSVSGGTSAWAASGRPVVTGARAYAA